MRKLENIEKNYIFYQHSCVAVSKYRSILIGEETYVSLARLKALQRKLTGKKVGFEDVLKKFVERRAKYLQLSEEVREYTEMFLSKLATDEEVLGVMIFGSLMKGNYDSFSDIDLFILTSAPNSLIYEKCDRIIESLEPLRKKLLVPRGNHMTLSPVVRNLADSKKIITIYFDIVDYGLILFDRNSSLEKFVIEVERLPYRRRMSPKGEVIEWN